MDLLTELQNQGLKLNKRQGGIYKWQDLAVDYWKKLNIQGKPNKNWFRFFKIADMKGKVGLLSSVYSVTVDANTTILNYIFTKSITIN
ncbi:hypothetical protein M0R04_12515 [Candidatus Dojkabacteria bacterium]|jgi:hypothetical protein|nr:hypothetical protein [Candidatus Dojkabacteria bacterium]